MSVTSYSGLEPTDSAGAPAPAPRAASIPAPGGSGINLLRSLRRHKLLALTAFLLVVAAGLPLAWWKGTPTYSSTAVVYVSPRFIANLQDSKEVNDWSDSQYHEYVQQNASTINRFDIVHDALKKLGPKNAVWVNHGESLDHAAARLQGALSIHPVPETYQIAVSLESAKQEGLAELINAIVNTYLERAKSEEFFASGQRIQDLTNNREQLLREIDTKSSRRLQIAQDLGVSSFTDNFVNPYDRLLVDAKEALSTARRQTIEAESELAALSHRQHPGDPASLRAIAEAEASKDTELTSLEANQNIRRTQLLTALSGLAPDHPGRRGMEKELADLERERQKIYTRIVASYSHALSAQRAADAYKAARVEQKLRKELGEQSSQASWFSKNYQEGMQLGAEIDQLRKRIESIQQRIDFLAFETKAPGFVRLFSAARPPQEPHKGGRKKYAALVLVAALLLGLAAPVAIDTLDSTLRTPRDLERILGFPPVGWILDTRDSSAEFSREQTLRLASRILQDRETNLSRIFAFTSVGGSSKTAPLVTDTASALKQLGASVLADTDRQEAGLQRPGSSLNGRPEPRPDHDSIVLLDLPPLMASVQAELLARGADVVILVIEAERVNKQELQRAAAVLERLRVKAVSAVLTGVRADAGDGFAAKALREFQRRA